jgi:hypothetical protein
MVADRKIVSYVKSSLDKGVPLGRIRSELYNAGWPRKDVEDAIASAGAPAESAAMPGNATLDIKARKDGRGSGPKSRKTIFIVAIIAILLGVGIFSYFIFVSLLLPSNSPIITPSNVTCNDGKCEGTETYENCPADCLAPSTNQNVTVSIKNPSRTVNSGESVSFDVEINSVSNLYGFQFDLEYDPNILEFSTASEGTFLNKNRQDGTFCIQPKASSHASVNYVTIACTRTGQTGGVDGSGVLESLTFTAKSTMAVELKLSNIKLVDSSVKQINIAG